MKRLIAIILPIIVLIACQKAETIEYFEYVDEASVPRITAENAKKEFDAGRAVFVDSRGEAAWKAERLPGALEISLNSPEDKYSQLPKGKKIIIYCS